jgi:hypothetical protein
MATGAGAGIVVTCVGTGAGAGTGAGCVPRVADVEGVVDVEVAGAGVTEAVAAGAGCGAREGGCVAAGWRAEADVGAAGCGSGTISTLLPLGETCLRFSTCTRSTTTGCGAEAGAGATVWGGAAATCCGAGVSLLMVTLNGTGGSCSPFPSRTTVISMSPLPGSTRLICCAAA